MANETLSTNMGLPVPGVGLTSGPQWATDVNNCLTIIDQHNHAAGSGVPITPAGLNISSDLSFQNNNLTLARSLRMNPQASLLALASDLGCLYVSGADLYYNDVNGNQVRMTQSGSIAGTPGNIANLVSPASASYVSLTKTFVFQSNSNTPANIDGASIILRNLSLNSFGLTLAPPNAMGSNTTITLPSIPLVKSILAMDVSGNISANYTVDNSTIAINSNVLQVPASGINTTQLADGAVTKPKQAAVGQQISSSSGSFSSAAGVDTAVTNLSVSITSTGRPIMIGMQPDGTASAAAIVSSTSSGGVAATYLIKRNGTTIFVFDIFASNSAPRYFTPPTALVDPIAAGTYTYQVFVNSSNGTCTVEANHLKLYAYEL